MKNQFLVCKQARGHMSSETQGKVIEDEYARAGQTPCGQSLQQQQQQQQQQQHKLYLHDYNYVVTVLQKL